MIEEMREWLLALIAVCMLCALAEVLMPAGPVKQAGKLVCGLVLLCAVLSPISKIDLREGQSWLESHRIDMQIQEQQLRENVTSEMKVIIEEKYAAYIVDKAEQLGICCQVQVKCGAGENGVFMPEHVELIGTFSNEEHDRLSNMIEEELLVPLEKQTYYSEEEVP